MIVMRWIGYSMLVDKNCPYPFAPQELARFSRDCCLARPLLMTFPDEQALFRCGSNSALGPKQSEVRSPPRIGLAVKALA